MTTDLRHVLDFVRRLLRNHPESELRRRLAAKRQSSGLRFPTAYRVSPENLDRCWHALERFSVHRELLADAQTVSQLKSYVRSIENFIGTVKVPVGIAGPLRVNGLFAQGDYLVPLATTEAALVASYHRGAQLITEAGGCTAMLLNEGLSRSPAFVFHGLVESGQFVVWATSQVGVFKELAERTTRHGSLIDMRVAVEGNHVYLIFEYTTGDASGQNMATLATDAIYDYITQHSPVKPVYSCLEGNMSGDKKASFESYLMVRGRKVSAEVRAPPELVRRRLHTTPQQMVAHWSVSAMGGVQSGTVGVEAHYANALAALYIACGQDAACVAESAVGVTRFQVDSQGNLYAAVTMPNIMVGTVGGGTHLPSQRLCLEILGLVGPGRAAAFAEVCAALCLAGELSIAGALCAGRFCRAHRVLGRARK